MRQTCFSYVSGPVIPAVGPGSLRAEYTIGLQRLKLSTQEIIIVVASMAETKGGKLQGVPNRQLKESFM